MTLKGVSWFQTFKDVTEISVCFEYAFHNMNVCHYTKKVRFWIILCPINFVGKIRDHVADMAKGFAAKDEMAAAHAAESIVIMSKPVRQGVLYDCITQLYTTGIFRKGNEYDVDNLDEPADVSNRGDENECSKEVQSSEEGRELQRSRGCHPKPWTAIRTSHHVLLVDDNSTSQQAMRHIILKAGMLCDVAGNGKEALAAIERAS